MLLFLQIVMYTYISAASLFTMLPVGNMELINVSSSSSRTEAETRAVRVHSHSEAERRRRQRINAHLATLRSLLPSATRLDKAALLGEVVRQVRELRLRAEEVAVAVPGEADEVGVEEDEEASRDETKTAGGEQQGRMVRAWVCCADRPGLMSELSRAVRSVRARAVRAEMVTVGGRTRSLLELEVSEAEAAAATERGRVTTRRCRRRSGPSCSPTDRVRLKTSVSGLVCRPGSAAGPR